MPKTRTMTGDPPRHCAGITLSKGFSHREAIDMDEHLPAGLPLLPPFLELEILSKLIGQVVPYCPSDGAVRVGGSLA